MATWLELVLRLGALLLFPALAVRAWRAGGARRLWRHTGIAIVLILVAAVFVATPAGGNVLTRSRGYGYTVPASLLPHGLTLGLPVVAASVVVRARAGRLSPAPALYAVGALAAGLGWIVGIGAAISIFHAVR